MGYLNLLGDVFTPTEPVGARHRIGDCVNSVHPQLPRKYLVQLEP